MQKAKKNNKNTGAKVGVVHTSCAPVKLMKNMAASVPVSTGGGGRGREGHYGYRAGKPGRLSLNLGRGFWENMLVDLSRVMSINYYCTKII